jgi:hypothetical protein
MKHSGMDVTDITQSMSLAQPAPAPLRRAGVTEITAYAALISEYEAVLFKRRSLWPQLIR